MVKLKSIHNAFMVFMHPPRYGSDVRRTFQARLIYQITLINLVGVLLALGMFIFSPDPNTYNWFWYFVLVICANLFTLALNQLGFTAKATVSSVLTAWLLATWMIYLAGGFLFATALGYIMCILLTALMLGKRAGVLAAIAASGLSLLFWQLSKQGAFSPTLEIDPWAAFAGQNSVFVMVSSSLYVMFNFLEKQNRTLQAIQADLKRKNLHLEQIVTERTAELRQSEEHYRAIVELQSELVCRYLPDTTLTFVNRAYCESVGRSAEQLIGRPFLDLLMEDVQPIATAYLQDIIARRGSDYIEHPTLNAKGEVRWQRWNDTVILNAEGNVIELQGVGIDITDRKLAEEAVIALNAELQNYAVQLEATNHDLKAFTYSVSHDLRAPLRSIEGFSEILLQTHLAQLPKDAQHYLERIYNNAKRMGRLIEAMMSLSRIHQYTLQCQPIALRDLVQRVVAQVGIRHTSNAQIKVGELPNCKGDPILIEQAFVNLLDNALKYSRERLVPQVEIDAIIEADSTVYFVRDNGIGFDLRYAERLFQPFQRLHGNTDYEGEGVGLAIVERIVRQHGGRIWADSAPNRGATFYFTLDKKPETR